MEKIELVYSGKKTANKQALSGVVGSGDLEVLFNPDNKEKLSVLIKTSVDGSESRWRSLLDRIADSRSLPCGHLVIHDFGATPGVARLRIEQVLEESDYE